MKYVYMFLFDFVIFFVIFFIFYLIYYRLRKKDYKKLKNGDYIKGFISKYNLDVRKTNYKTILKVLAFDNAFTIAFTSALIVSIKKRIWKILIAFAVLMLLLFSLYTISGNILKKKEGKKNE